MPSPLDPARDFKAAARPRRGVVAEFWTFLRYYKKWWLLPVLALFVAMGALVVLGGSSVAPFLYALF